MLNTLAHSDYVSGHCLDSGAAQPLRQIFDDDGVKVSVTCRGPNGVTRTYAGFTPLEREVEEARILHTSGSTEKTNEIGQHHGFHILKS